MINCTHKRIKGRLELPEKKTTLRIHPGLKPFTDGSSKFILNLWDSKADLSLFQSKNDPKCKLMQAEKNCLCKINQAWNVSHCKIWCKIWYLAFKGTFKNLSRSLKCLKMIFGIFRKHIYIYLLFQSYRADQKNWKMTLTYWLSVILPSFKIYWIIRTSRSLYRSIYCTDAVFVRKQVLMPATFLLSLCLSGQCGYQSSSLE